MTRKRSESNVKRGLVMGIFDGLSKIASVEPGILRNP